jgi:hypothetical protein
MATKPAKKTARKSTKAAKDPAAKNELPGSTKPPYNEETMQVLRDADEGKNLLRYPSEDAMYEDLGIRKRGKA